VPTDGTSLVGAAPSVTELARSPRIRSRSGPGGVGERASEESSEEQQSVWQTAAHLRRTLEAAGLSARTRDFLDASRPGMAQNRGESAARRLQVLFVGGISGRLTESND
jgi:hypothetical protein